MVKRVAEQIWGTGHPHQLRRRISTVAVHYGLLAAGIWVLVSLVGVVAGAASTWRLLELFIPLGLVLGVGVSLWILARSYLSIGAGLPYLEPSPTDRARIKALIEGVGQQLGISDARVRILNDPSINAAAVPRGRQHFELLVTKGSLDSLGIIELEAMVARELIAVRSGIVWYNAALAGLQMALGQRRSTLADWQRQEAALLDLAGTGATRYPQAMSRLLLAAIEAGGERPLPFAPWLWLYPYGVAGAEEDMRLRASYLADEVWTARGSGE